MAADVPTLYDWAGGSENLNRLTATFYAKVAKDPVVGPVFKAMSSDHPAHVAAFIGEEQRRRWISLLMDAADEVGLPDDPEFRSAFAAYIEWGSRLARMNSTLGATCDPEQEPMPQWGWGVPGGPYTPPAKS